MSATHGLHRALSRHPDRLAMEFADRKATWRELGQVVSRLAGALRALGIGRGDRVAVLMLNQDSYLELYLGVAWLAAVIVPLNTRWSDDENRLCLEDCRPSVLVVDDTFAAVGAALTRQLPDLKLIHAGRTGGEAPPGSEDYARLVAGGPAIPDAEAADGELAGIFYTGGTTGRSKGVMLSHRNILSSALSIAYELGDRASEIYLHAAPMFHLGDLGFMFARLLAGSTHTFLGSFSPAGLARTIERYRVTETLLVPTMIGMFVDQAPLGDFDLSTLRRIIYGASPIDEALLERAISRLPNVEFVQAYGMTELAPIATLLSWQDHIGAAKARGKHRSAGRAAATVNVRVVDRDGIFSPCREVGEIVVRGSNVMLGYWDRPEETAAALRDGWMHTGDCGYLDEDGYLYVIDRMKDMIISGGENVYSAEVENCIAQHPAVMQCAVVGIPHERWGETVHAIVVRSSGAVVSESDLIAFCRERIANYKCPTSVAIRDVPLPLSGVGKVLKRELREAASRSADTAGAPRYSRPRTVQQ